MSAIGERFDPFQNLTAHYLLAGLLRDLRIDVRAHALRRRPLSLLRPRSDRPRGEGHLPYETVVVDLDDRPAWIYEKNPLGKVPVLEEDDVRPPRVGRDHGVPRGALPGAAALARGSGRARRRPPARRALRPAQPPVLRASPGRGRRAPSASTQQLAALDSLLAGRPFLTGREFGLADAAYLPWILRAETIARRRPRRPSRPLADWVGTQRATVPSVAAETSSPGGAVNVREATDADRPQLEELVLAYLDEHWARPYPPAAARPVPE